MLSKEKVGEFAAEFIGTALLVSVFLAVGNTFGSGTASWYVAISAGVALSLIVGLFGRTSGAQVNPAVTIALWTQKKIETSNAVVYIVSQLLGGAVALSFYNYMTGGDLANAGSAVFHWNIFWAEAVGSAIYGMGVASVITQKLEGYYAAFVTGLSLTMGALVASVASAGFLNPAVALGNNAWDRTLVVAPIVGMTVGMYIYMTYVATAKKKRK